MQTFRKIHSKLSLVALLFLSITLISSCDTSKDDILTENKPQEIEKESTVYTTSDLSSYAIDLPRLLGISQVSDLKLTTPPNFGSVELVKEGIVLYKAHERNNPRSDQFGYQVNGQDGILKIEYRPDSVSCEIVSDYYITSKNVPTNCYFLANDFYCSNDSFGNNTSDIEILSFEVDNQDLRNPNEIIDFVLYPNYRYLKYTPPIDFVGFQECLYTIYTSDNRVFTSTITFEVLADIDSTGGDTTCISLVDDVYRFVTDLPSFIGQNSSNAVRDLDSSNVYTIVFPVYDSYWVEDSINNGFVEGKLYLYVPYTENDTICNPSEWDLTVDWNGIVGGVQIFEGNYNPVFFVPTPPLQQTSQIQFSYTLRNRITGQEQTAEVVIRE